MASIALVRPSATQHPGISSISGRQAEGVFDITLGATYATGGDAVDFAAAYPTRLSANSKIIDVQVYNVPLGYIPLWDSVNNKLKFFSAPGTELANASAALANAVVRARVSIQRG